MRKRSLIMLSAAIFTAGLCLTPASLAAPASLASASHAAVHAVLTRSSTTPRSEDFCSELGKGWCMNADGCSNSSGTSVIDWYGGENCEYFSLYPGYGLDICNGQPFVTETCPFTVGSGLNSEFAGSTITEVEYVPSGKCIATNSSGAAILGACGNSQGVGAADGTIMVFVDNDRSPDENALINRYWSDVAYADTGQRDNPIGACSTGGLGSLVGLAQSPLSNSGCLWATPPP